MSMPTKDQQAEMGRSINARLLKKEIIASEDAFRDRAVDMLISLFYSRYLRGVKPQDEGVESYKTGVPPAELEAHSFMDWAREDRVVFEEVGARNTDLMEILDWCVLHVHKGGRASFANYVVSRLCEQHFGGRRVLYGAIVVLDGISPAGEKWDIQLYSRTAD